MCFLTRSARQRVLYLPWISEATTHFTQIKKISHQTCLWFFCEIYTSHYFSLSRLKCRRFSFVSLNSASDPSIITILGILLCQLCIMLLQRCGSMPVSAASRLPPPCERLNPAGTDLKFWGLTPLSCDHATQPMGEHGSDFSLGEERGLKREEEKETSTYLCSWFGQPAGTDCTSESAATDSTLCGLSECLDGTL